VQLHLTGEDICAKCHRRVEGEVLIVGNQRFHRACFVCIKCGVSVEGVVFAATDQGKERHGALQYHLTIPYQGLMCKPCNLKAHDYVCSGSAPQNTYTKHF